LRTKQQKKKDTSVIPIGDYCYEPVISDFLGLGRLVVKKCPYWRSIEGQPPQANGYCDYLEKGDFDGSTYLLWDQCKECGVNTED